ncbi:hypothetical protein NDU88_002280 [Pleurodeles waltl]|uniref:Uncharacterized protein n=1 Tax=Pleurodeles waltl TaxID=8319 RepID=A0AAV7PB69_PLEWA|nr:hypothetical protein NDU88_002280 [Pleurodeles waltl]
MSVQRTWALWTHASGAWQSTSCWYPWKIVQTYGRRRKEKTEKGSKKQTGSETDGTRRKETETTGVRKEQMGTQREHGQRPKERGKRIGRPEEKGQRKQDWRRQLAKNPTREEH